LPKASPWEKRHAWLQRSLPKESLRGLREKRVYPKRVSWVPPKESPWENPILAQDGKLFIDMSFYTYILQSQSHLTYYYGQCKNLERRLKQHNAGKVRYTKGRMPWKLHYFETFETRSEAMQREKFFKSIEGYKFLKSEKII
jgi:putative endonuclease